MEFVLAFVPSLLAITIDGTASIKVSFRCLSGTPVPSKTMRDWFESFALRCFVSAAGDMEILLVAGGTQAGSAAGDDLTSTELYEPATNSWTDGPSMNTPRTGASATVLPNGRVLMVGGEHFGVATSSAEMYDPVTNTWSPIAEMSLPRYEHSATLLPSGVVLIVGGAGRASYDPTEATAEIYDPQVNQ